MAGGTFEKSFNNNFYTNAQIWLSSSAYMSPHQKQNEGEKRKSKSKTE